MFLSRLVAGAAVLWAALMAADPHPRFVIAHRGASGYAPEHTLAAYRLAIAQHADFVEPDLAVTKDGALLCLHDDTLERTTNVAEVFPDRASREPLGRGAMRHWIANDFTVDELKRLDAGRWFDPKFSGERLVTWQEAIDLVRGKAGLYPELKSPRLYQSRGVDMERLFVESMRRNRLDTPASLKTTPVIVQSFDDQTIRRVARDLPTVPRVLLVDTADATTLTDERLADIASYATGIGPEKSIVEQNPKLVERAHGAGLTVTCWTFRAGSTGQFPSVRDEMAHFLYTFGIDALFTNNPDQFPR